MGRLRLYWAPICRGRISEGKISPFTLLCALWSIRIYIFNVCNMMCNRKISNLSQNLFWREKFVFCAEDTFIDSKGSTWLQKTFADVLPNAWNWIQTDKLYDDPTWQLRIVFATSKCALYFKMVCKILFKSVLVNFY